MMPATGRSIVVVYTLWERTVRVRFPAPRFMDQEQEIALKQLEELRKRTGKPMRLAAEGWGSEWQTLIAIIMSARTRDETTIEVCKKLFAKYKTVGALAGAKENEVAEIIRPVNFYRNKTKNIISACRKLVEQFGDTVPHTLDELVTIPGVGRKTANVFRAEYGASAIGVDTHVSFISQKLGWTAHKDPSKIEKDLEKLFPQSHWRVVNQICVRFGKTHTSRREKDGLLEEIKDIL
ncbi:MAG: endonuclease III [Parcubacteria group bacterium Gr01-1014_17]|nr:MAG: endonuclease III [Parcubacteria group bacterium Gr01-1014_17]